MTSIHRAAHGERCTLRLERCCTGYAVELHHLRMFGRFGVAQKASDREAILVCRQCHDRIHHDGWKGLESDILRALLETHDVLEREGRLVVT